MNDEPLAIHVEANPERRGTFTLYQDHLDVVLKPQLKGTLTESIPLSELSASIAWLKVKSSIFNGGLWLLCLSVVGLALVESFRQLESGRALLYAFILFSLFLVIVGSRRILFLVVRSKEGRDRLAVGVGKAGRKGLETFAETFRDAVETANAKPG